MRRARSLLVAALVLGVAAGALWLLPRAGPGTGEASGPGEGPASGDGAAEAATAPSSERASSLQTSPFVGEAASAVERAPGAGAEHRLLVQGRVLDGKRRPQPGA